MLKGTGAPPTSVCRYCVAGGYATVARQGEATLLHAANLDKL